MNELGGGTGLSSTQAVSTSVGFWILSTISVAAKVRRIVLDRDLAALYGVTTARLNEAVKRNVRRFPEDFMFRVTGDEHAALMSQIAASKPGRGGHRKMPFAVIEHGAIRAANVLNSDLAAEMSVHVVRAFVRFRELLLSNKSLAHQIEVLERKYRQHDKAIVAMLSALRQLMNPPAPRHRGIGFAADLEEKPTAEGPADPPGNTRKSPN